MTASVFDNLNKRQHVYEYRTDCVPDYDTIHKILHDAWVVTPSKQNIMPYKLNVLGPEHTFTKQQIYHKVVKNEHRMNTESEIAPIDNESNPFCKNVLHNPYLIVFSQRVCTDIDINPFYKARLKKGQFIDQCSAKHVNRIKPTTSFEAGLFAQNIAALCLEKNIYYSFTGCFPGNKEDWKNIPFIDEDPLMLMSLGYPKTFRRECIPNDTNDDYKTAFENVVHFE